MEKYRNPLATEGESIGAFTRNTVLIRINTNYRIRISLHRIRNTFVFRRTILIRFRMTNAFCIIRFGWHELIRIANLQRLNATYVFDTYRFVSKTFPIRIICTSERTINLIK